MAYCLFFTSDITVAHVIQSTSARFSYALNLATTYVIAGNAWETVPTSQVLTEDMPAKLNSSQRQHGLDRLPVTSLLLLGQYPRQYQRLCRR